MPTYSDEVNVYNPNAIQQGIDGARDYYVTSVTNDGIWVTPHDAKPVNGAPTSTTRGWHIADALEYFRGTVRYIKAWLNGSTPTVRLGQDSSGHADVTPSGLEVFTGSSTSVAKFGSTSRVGDTSGKHINLTSSGIEFHDGSTAIGTFGQKGARSYPTAWDFDYDTAHWQDAMNAVTFRSMVSAAGTDSVLLDTGGVIGGYVQSGGKWYQIGIRQDTMRAALTAAGYDADDVLYDHVDSTSWNLQAANVTGQNRSVFVRSSLATSAQYDVCEFVPDFFRTVDQSEKGLKVDANFDAYDIGCRDIDVRDVHVVGDIECAGTIYSQAMAGIIQMFAGSTAPSGWLVCDGSAVSRTTYAILFAAIGTTWGTGDGSTTFNLPDLRGRAPIGAGTGSGLTARTLGSTGGSEALQSHDHNAASNGYNVPGKSGGWNWRTTSSGSNSNYNNTPMGGSTAAIASITRTGSAGSGNAGNMQPFAVINFIICTGKTS